MTDADDGAARCTGPRRLMDEAAGQARGDARADDARRGVVGMGLLEKDQARDEIDILDRDSHAARFITIGLRRGDKGQHRRHAARCTRIARILDEAEFDGGAPAYVFDRFEKLPVGVDLSSRLRSVESEILRPHVDMRIGHIDERGLDRAAAVECEAVAHIPGRQKAAAGAAGSL